MRPSVSRSSASRAMALPSICWHLRSSSFVSVVGAIDELPQLVGQRVVFFPRSCRTGDIGAHEGTSMFGIDGNVLVVRDSRQLPSLGRP